MTFGVTVAVKPGQGIIWRLMRGGAEYQRLAIGHQTAAPCNHPLMSGARAYRRPACPRAEHQSPVY